MTKFKDSLFGPTLILLLICTITTFAMATVYKITGPAILQGEIKAADEMRRMVLDNSGTFTEIKGLRLPEGVSEIYKADNGTGYVIRSSAKGYGGPVTFMIGIDDKGGVTGINVFDHSETPGLGTKVDTPDYLAKYKGNTDPYSIDGISGATRTSNALKDAISQALEGYKLAEETKK